MKKINNCTVILIAVFTILAGCRDHSLPSRNLVINGDAEESRYDSLPAAWINIQGHWIVSEADSIKHDCAFAQSGKALFFAGNDTLGILQQDVDITVFANAIQSHDQQFIFSGYVQSLDQGPNSDQAQIIVTGLDKEKRNPKTLFDSDTTRSINKWMHLQDTFPVSPGTKFIRIRLIAIRHVGGDNDGYFDDISLINFNQSTHQLALYILLAIAIIVIISLYAIIKRNKKSTT